jgi:peptidoglycan/LPS O-acetylase OafA/YrhL
MAVMMLLQRHKGLSIEILVLFLAAVGLVWNWLIPGNWMCGFFLEYWLHFAMGVCLFFVLVRRPTLRLVFVGALVSLFVAASVRLWLHRDLSSEDMRAMYELSFLSVATLLLFFLRPFGHRISESMVWRPVAALGLISYSLYLIQQFNLAAVAGVAGKLLPSLAPHAVFIAVEIALFVVLATIFWSICERPFLHRKRQLRKSDLAAEIAS